MDKHIEFQNMFATNFEYSPNRVRKTGPAFQEFFNKHVQKSSEPMAATSPILIGKLSDKHRTVSELLLNHKDFEDKGWEIIFSGKNQHKPYTKIPPGTSIYYNPVNGELSWPTPFSKNQPLTGKTPQPPAHILSTPPSPPTGNEVPQVGEPVHTASADTTVILGTVNDKLPTVSHLLAATPEFDADKWNILSASANKETDFTKIPNGAQVRLNLQTKEISWQTKATSQNEDLEERVGITTSTRFAQDKLQALSTASQLQTAPNPATEKLLFGTIDQENPTVSHLLRSHPHFASETWTLLSHSSNRDKPFHRIPPGTEMYLDIKTQEISWKQLEPASQLAPVASLEEPPPAPDLREAVQPFLGKPYEEIDCYNLLVHGLRKMGIPYMGKDGLRNKLTEMAEQKGLPANAYLNGEGIVEAAGKRVLAHSFNRVNDSTKEADKIFREMKPHLQNGQILSFSTPTRGHTGIVSQYDNQWTFINSGRMDNHVDQPGSPKEVGEENLLDEILNWFTLANKNRESLVVTLGQLEEDKIRSAFQPEFKLSRRL